MIASYPDRRFQLWEYRVSHGSLLVRSPKGPNTERNIDLVFVGVEYLAVPRILHGLILERGTAQDVREARASVAGAEPQRVFALESEGRRHLIVAVACRVDENEGDIFDTPFE